MGLPFGFGERLAKVRQKRGLRQQDVGVGLGTDGVDVSKSVVYGWEKEQHYPRVDQLRQMCQRLGTTADYLVYGFTQELPFSIALRTRLSLLQKDELAKIESLIRVHLGMPVVTAEQDSQEDESSAADQVQSGSESGRTVPPVQKHSATLGRPLGGVRGGSNQPGEVPQPRRRRNS